MKLYTIFAALLLIVFSSVNIDARPQRVGQIPNGSKNACLNCHFGSGGSRNSFGKTIEDNFLSGGNVVWNSALANIDSDNDGFSNGTELQDKNGTWKEGQADPGVSSKVSNPGNTQSVPPAESVYENGNIASLTIAPNPVNTVTRIDFSLRSPGFVKVVLYNMQGEKQATLENGYLLEGNHHLVFDLDQLNLPTGMYLLSLTSDRNTVIEKLVRK